MRVGKLIVDEAAIELLTRKLRTLPVVVGSDGRFVRPGIVDLVEDLDSLERWQPCDQRTKLLVLSHEAAREVQSSAAGFADPHQRRRVVKNLSIPICNLMDVVHKLTGALNDPDAQRARVAWPQHDQDSYKSVGRRFRGLRQNGPVRRVRNRIAAHLDVDAFSDPGLRIDVEEFLAALGDSLLLLFLAARHPSRFFTWIRFLGETPDTRHCVVETMYESPECVRWYTDHEGNVQDVECVSLAADPRIHIQDAILEAIGVHNAMIECSGSARPAIWTAPTADLLLAEMKAKARSD